MYIETNFVRLQKYFKQFIEEKNINYENINIIFADYNYYISKFRSFLQPVNYDRKIILHRTAKSSRKFFIIVSPLYIIIVGGTTCAVDCIGIHCM